MPFDLRTPLHHTHTHTHTLSHTHTRISRHTHSWTCKYMNTKKHPCTKSLWIFKHTNSKWKHTILHLQPHTKTRMRTNAWSISHTNTCIQMTEHPTVCTHFFNHFTELWLFFFSLTHSSMHTEYTRCLATANSQSSWVIYFRHTPSTGGKTCC